MFVFSFASHIFSEKPNQLKRLYELEEKYRAISGDTVFILHAPEVKGAENIEDFTFHLYQKPAGAPVANRIEIFRIGPGDGEFNRFIEALKSQKFYKDMNKYSNHEYPRRNLNGSEGVPDFLSAFIPQSSIPSSNMHLYYPGEYYSRPQVCFQDPAIAKILSTHLNLVVEGVAGSGKSHMLKELRDSGKYGPQGCCLEVVVFHPSTSYEEFMTGVRPNFIKNTDEGDFVTHEGIFIQMCNRAANDSSRLYLLFIDEINRANTSRVFGDLMLVLEKSKRQDFAGLPTEGRDGALFEASVQDMPGDYVRLQTPIFKNGKEYNKLAVPANLHVLGTMNTTDRSVGTIDLALRRRFHWVTQHPLTAEELQKTMEESGEEYPENIASWYENANVILLNQVGPDARLGHAYFFGKDGDEEAIAEALLNQLKEVAFTFNVSQTILDEIGPLHGQKIFIRGAGLGARPDIVDESYQG